MKITSKKYEIGYGNPPKHSRWKKGQCGNPKRIRKRPGKPVAEPALTGNDEALLRC
jgi:hypothetical protein